MLPYSFNVKNTLVLMTYLKDTQLHDGVKLVSFGIKNMYTNNPTDMLLSIITLKLDSNRVDANIK